jgi:hypothetical protein
MPCLCDLLLQPVLLIGSVLALAIWVIALMILVGLT